MLFEDRKDFTIKEGKRANGTPIWKVVLGKTETYTICRTLEEAQKQAAQVQNEKEQKPEDKKE